MKRNYIIVLMATMLLLSTGLKAQIKNEIESFVDSSQIIYKKGRQLIAKSLTSDDYKKISAVYEYLNKNVKGNQSSVFSYREHISICLLLENWDELLYNIEHYKEKVNVYADRNLLNDNLLNLLTDKIQSRYNQLLTDVDNASIDNSGKQAIRLFLYIIKSNVVNREYSSMKKKYTKEYKKSKYSAFVFQFLPPIIIDFSLSYSFGGGIFTPVGNINNYFRQGGAYDFGFDLNMAHGFVSLFFNGSIISTKKEFSVNVNGSNKTINKGYNFAVINGGIRTGYYLVRNKRFKIAPEILCSGYAITSSTDDSYDTDNENFNIINSFAYGAGFHCEYKIMDFDSPFYFYSYYGKGYIGLKFDAEYMQIAKVPDNTFCGGASFATLSFFYGFGEF